MGKPHGWEIYPMHNALSNKYMDIATSEGFCRGGKGGIRTREREGGEGIDSHSSLLLLVVLDGKRGPKPDG